MSSGLQVVLTNNGNYILGYSLKQDSFDKNRWFDCYDDEALWLRAGATLPDFVKELEKNIPTPVTLKLEQE